MARGMPLALLAIAWPCLASWAQAQPMATDQTYLVVTKTLSYFRTHSLNAEQIAHVDKLIQDLGDLRFRTREAASKELTATGLPVLPSLRRVVHDPDLERARRAATCILEIETHPLERPGLAMPAARILAQLKPAGAIEALITFLPFNEDEWVEEEVLTALVELVRDGKTLDPVVLGFLNDPHPSRRAACGLLAGRSREMEYRLAVHKLLHDMIPNVRLRAAQGLLAGRDKTAVPALIDLVGHGPPGIANRAEETLFRMAGNTAPVISSSTSTSTQRRNEQAWAQWWREHESTFELTQSEEQRDLGLTLVAEMDSNQVWEFSESGETKWSIKGLSGPMHARMLRNGHVLIAEYEGKRVSERDLKGNVVWLHSVQGNPLACQRLNNGNTFIATHHSIIEVTPAGKEVFNQVPSRGIFLFDAQKLSNGHVVYIANPGIIEEVDPLKDQVIRSIHLDEFGGWCSVEVLPNGRFLVALFSEGKVQELDAAGKILWQCRVPGACHATRLPNGGTLVASMTQKKVIELDRDGKTVRERATDGRPWRVHHR